MRYRLTARLPVPIERAFAYSVDPRNTAAYHGRGTSITKVTEGDVGLGTVFRYDRRGKPGAMVTEITAFEPPHAFTSAVRTGHSKPEAARMTFVERDGVTAVTTEAEFTLPPRLPGWLRRALTPICFAMLWPMLWVATRVAERMARRALLGPRAVGTDGD